MDPNDDGTTQGDWRTEDLWSGIALINGDEMKTFQQKCGRYGWYNVEISKEMLQQMLDGKVLAIGDLEYTTFIVLKGDVSDAG